MQKRINHHFDDMVLAVVVWMCALPLIGLFVLPFLGLKVSLLVATGLLIALFIICWGICGWKIFKS
jgi:hypothetical protein